MSSVTAASMRDAFARGLRRFLPSACAICAAWPAEPFCATCIAQFTNRQPRCERCAIVIAGSTTICGACSVGAPPLDRCIAAVAWDWPWSDCIARFKFGREPGWADALGTLLRRTPGVEALLQHTDLLLPVPLAPQRLRERGFNQSLELARRLAPHKTEPSLLRRVRHRAPQASLDRAGRLNNLRGAFALEPAPARRLAGRRVTLLDDVMTTGATVHEAARTLRAGGATWVAALVLARTDATPAAGAAGAPGADGVRRR